MATQNQKFRINVGGKIFETTATTLSNAGENSILKTMLDEEFGEQYFIDRDPSCFKVLLHLLRTGKLLVPSSIPDTLLIREAHYYGLLDHVRAVESKELDGNNLKLASSIAGRTLLKEGALIRANGNGSCSVANGRLFHVYDWTLQERVISNFENMKIFDMEWYDSESIIISAHKNSDPKSIDGGGVGLFNVHTNQLKHKFQLTQELFITSRGSGDEADVDQFSTITPGNLAVDNVNNKIFCCCKYNSCIKLDDIGIWDTTTGQAIGFFRGNGVSEANKSNVFNSFKLQWLPTKNCLVAASNSRHSNIISIYDPRSKAVNLGSWEQSRYEIKCAGGMFVDMVVMEEMNCICVKDDRCFFGFFDLRKLVERRFNDVWQSFDEAQSSDGERFVLLGEKKEVIAPCSKVRWHGGKLFCSRNNTISVYSGTGFTYQLDSQVQPRYGGGPIHDFSIGGDRLFSLQAHKEDELYDINVWETPPSPLPPILM